MIRRETFRANHDSSRDLVFNSPRGHAYARFTSASGCARSLLGKERLLATGRGSRWTEGRVSGPLRAIGALFYPELPYFTPRYPIFESMRCDAILYLNRCGKQMIASRNRTMNWAFFYE